MDYLKVNGIRVPYSNDFTMSKVPNVTNETVTLSGKTIWDYSGWKYENVDLSWDYLKHEEYLQLLEATNPMNGTFNLTFINENEQEETVTAYRLKAGRTKTQLKGTNGEIIWTGITLTLAFPDCYK